MKRYKGSYLSYVLAYFFFYFCMAVFSSVLSVYLTGTGKSAPEMSFIVSAASFFTFFCLPIIGYLNDKIQKPKLICISLMVVVGVLGIVFSISRSVAVLFLLDGLIMSGINGVMTITEKLAGSGKYRYGSIRVWGTFGYAVGAQAAGFAIERISPSFIFVLLFFGAVIAIIGLAGLETSKNIKVEESTPLEVIVEDVSKPKKSGVREFLRDRNFLLYLLIVFFFWGASGVNMTYVPVLLTEIGVGTTAVGTVLFVSTLVEIPIIIFSHKFMDEMTVKQLLFVIFALSVVQFVCFGLTTSSVPIITIIVLCKAMATTLFVMINLKVAMLIVGDRYATTALSVFSAVNAVGAIIMHNIAGFVVEALGIQVMYLGLTAVIGLAFVSSLFLKLDNTKSVFGNKSEA